MPSVVICAGVVAYGRAWPVLVRAPGEAGEPDGSDPQPIASSRVKVEDFNDHLISRRELVRA
jgi:hypothetical protein